MTFPALETWLRRAANRFGVDITRYRPERSPAGLLATMLHNHRVDMVLDVGANTGQFAAALRKGGYAGRIVSFEPLESAYEDLLAASSADALWEIAPRCALGDTDGHIDIHVAANSVSSSALPMLRSHEAAAPESAVIRSERVPVGRLDTVAREYLASSARPFMKVDTQGFEDRVLDGAGESMHRLVGLQLELSFVPLYADQQLFDALMERMRRLGFSVWAIWPGFHDPGSGRMLQVDAVFFRDDTGAGPS